jgi:hypothetical protein
VKKYGLYLLYVLGFILILSIDFAAYKNFQTHQQETFKIFPNIFYYSLSFTLTGLYLGVPILIKNYSLEGNWTVNWPRLLFFGIPLLYLVLYPLIYFEGTPLAIRNFTFNQMFLTFIDIPPLLLGYLIMTSFIKTK